MQRKKCGKLRFFVQNLSGFKQVAFETSRIDSNALFHLLANGWRAFSHQFQPGGNRRRGFALGSYKHKVNVGRNGAHGQNRHSGLTKTADTSGHERQANAGRDRNQHGLYHFLLVVPEQAAPKQAVALVFDWMGLAKPQ
jgi:hypothetical protein